MKICDFDILAFLKKLIDSKNIVFWTIISFLFYWSSIEASVLQDDKNHKVTNLHFDNITSNYSSKMYFIENKGQWSDEVLFLTRLNGYDIWITKYGLNFTFYKVLNDCSKADFYDVPIDSEFSNIEGQRVLLMFENSNQQFSVVKGGKKNSYYNYIINSDRANGISNVSYVSLYKEVVLKNIYDGIDIRYYFRDNKFRFDFIVHPGADPQKIRFTLSGAEDQMMEKNKIEFSTKFGKVAIADLYTFQNDMEIVESSFKFDNQAWTFSIGNYDKSQILVIDPLIFSTYIGGSSIDRGYDLYLDASGFIYITGETQSVNYDTTPGVFQSINAGSVDVFVSKFNPSGNGLIFSTYIGGSNNDIGNAIAMDGSGNIYLTGNTNSTNFPVSPGAFQTIFDGGTWDAFVTKLNPLGTAIIYSTYLGGSGTDNGYDIAVDASGSAYIAGHTYSSNFDITAGSFQTSFGGGGTAGDGFVCKFNNNASALIYSTYLGGNSSDWATAITIDGSGNAYVCGATYSSNFPVTPGAFQTSINGLHDCFVAKLNSSGSALFYSTFVGGSNNDGAYDLVINNSDEIYVAGHTLSSNFPVTPGGCKVH